MSLRQRVVKHCAGNFAPLLGVVVRDDYNVSRDTQRIQNTTQSHHLLSLACDEGLDHKKVEIAIDLGIAATM